MNKLQLPESLSEGAAAGFTLLIQHLALTFSVNSFSAGFLWLYKKT